MDKPVLVINGPNLNLLGKRQPEIYGAETLEDVARMCTTIAEGVGLKVGFFQSNHEGALIDAVQEARETTAGIVINPGAYSHTSVGLLDALNAYDPPVIEVHISNIHQREAFRHHSYVSSRANAVIAGCGTQGYSFGILRLAQLLAAG